MTGLIFYTIDVGKKQIKLRPQLQTAWLAQFEMAKIFDATKQNLYLHLKNIYENGELSRVATTEKSSAVHSG